MAVAHGEGRVHFSTKEEQRLIADSGLISIKYVDNRGSVASIYPSNPNGSPEGIAGLSSKDGRVTIMMPHPERNFRTITNSWHPKEWGEHGPWLRIFQNARKFIG